MSAEQTVRVAELAARPVRRANLVLALRTEPEACGISPTWAENSPFRLVTTDLDGGDRQPFPTIAPDCFLELLCCMPGRLSG